MTKLPDARLFIDGKQCDASNGATFDVISPWTGEPVGKAADCTADDVNAAIAAAIVMELGLDEAQVTAGLASFCGLPHRMERLGEHGGVLFVNDSKATNPASTAPALAAYPRIHWIVGGLPKGDDLDECAPHFGNVVAAYTIGEAGPRFAALLEPVMHVERCEMMSEAVRRAVAVAQPGDVVLLSPACASFDQFRDYEVRGDNFRELVAELAGGTAALREGPVA